MLNSTRIYIDFQKVDDEGRLILTCAGTIKDLNAYGIELKQGLRLTFYSDDADDEGNRDDLVIDGTVHYDEVSERWTAIIDWSEIKHISDLREG